MKEATNNSPDNSIGEFGYIVNRRYNMTVRRPIKARGTQHDRTYRPRCSEARRKQNRRNRRLFKQKLREYESIEQKEIDFDDDTL